MMQGKEDMEISEGLLISNRRCLFDRTSETIVIADLHLGLEGSAKDDGVYFPRVQKEKVVSEIEAILDVYKPRRFVIDGDFKHTFDRNLYQEWEEIKEVLGLLQDRVEEVMLVRGNHDNFIAGILPKGTALPLTLDIGRLHMTHGQRKETRWDVDDGGRLLVLAHEHPSALLRDKVGASVRLPCFLFHPEDRILILPAFSTLTKGSDVLSRGFLSKVLKAHEPGEFLAFAVSEIGLLELGRLGDLVHRPRDDPDWQ